MENNNINHLIHKYYTPDGANKTANPRKHKNEQYTKQYTKQTRQQHNQRKRQAILSELLREAPILLTPTQTQQIRYWINQFNNDFKNFHRQASNETIILAFIIIQAKQANPKIQLENYKICHKYNLTCPIFTLIQNRLIFKLMQTTPLTYNQKKVLDNHIANKKPI